jgi:hypothetical protein
MPDIVASQLVSEYHNLKATCVNTKRHPDEDFLNRKSVRTSRPSGRMRLCTPFEPTTASAWR